MAEEIILIRRKTTILHGRAAVEEWKHQGIVQDGRFYLKRCIGRRFSQFLPDARDGVHNTQSVEIIRREQTVQKAA